jgi:CRISPR/Cas system-associated endonuclease Cas1
MHLINSEIERLKSFIQYVPTREEYERAADVQIRSLPSAEKADRLLRYETHLERQLYRAMDQQERVQRRRMGDAVPPPLNLNFGRGR